jgi:hypothetical protein
VCGWPENLSLRLDFFKLYENLSAMVHAPPPAAIKSAFQSWAEGSLAAVNGIQQALMDAAPLGGKRAQAAAAAPATPVAAAPVVELSLPSPLAAAAPVAEAMAAKAEAACGGERAKRRGAPGWLRAAGGALLAAAAVAAARQHRAAKPTAQPAAKPAAQPAAAPAAAAELPTAAAPPGPPPLLGQA